MSKPILFETSVYRDIIELGLCMFIHQLCDGNQFSETAGTDFASFINLKTDTDAQGKKITVLPKQNLRVCYLIRAVSETISSKELAAKWRRMFLKSCEISHEYYYKHNADLCSYTATDSNKEYRKDVDNAIVRWRELCHTP